MSKQFAKILTICALAIIIPIAIVGTAILLSNSVKYTVSTEVVGLEENIGNVSIKINGKEGSSLSVSRNSIVKLTIDTTGYSFNGWYEGAEEQAKVDAEENVIRNYEFKINQDVKFKAIVDRLVFNVSYNGAEAVEVKYGAELDNGGSANAGATGYQRYVGWQVNGEGDAYTHATFPETEETVSLTVAREAAYENLYFAFNINAAKLNGEEIEDVSFDILRDKDGYPLASTNQILVEEETLLNREANFKNEVLGDLFTIYDNAGNKYQVSNISLRIGQNIKTIAKDADAVNAITIQEVIDKYNAIEDIDNAVSGGTITLSLTYYMIAE